MSKKRAMTLIELMIAITLVLLATSAIGWKMYGMIAKKRFTASVERFRSRLLTCRRLALNMQSDWRGDLYVEGNQAMFSSRCVDDPRVPDLSTLSLGSIEFFLDGEEYKKISFDFTSSGDILPQGRIQIRSGDLGSVEWDLLDLFSMQEGKKLGPAYPER
ncbi:MAG: Tfp pilus assembly protein FimT/FimU [Chlamydiales bacterium]